jgi:TRAP-type C4-dicarboxylate transport system permease large subunit
MADQFATQIALGVLLCAVSIALPAYTGGGRWEGFGVIGMFLLAALAVGLFIWGGTVFSQQKKQLNDRPITASAKQLANKTTGEYTRQFAAGLIAGIMICIGSLIPPIISAYIPGFISENAGGALFLAIAGLGSYLIIYVSINYSQLKRYAYATTAANSTAWYHGTDDDAANYWEQPHKHHQNTRARQDIALFHQVYWPTVLIIYLLVSFLLHGWAYSWLIFIIGGVMQNIITAVIARRDYSE